MNLKHSALVLFFFMYFIGYANAQQSADPSLRWLVPVTWDTVNAIQNALHDSRINSDDLRRVLVFRISKPVSIASVQNNAMRVEGPNESGPGLVWSGQNRSPGRVIDMTDNGTLHRLDSDIVEIIFRDNDNILLRFRRTSQGRYELFSAVIGVETNTLVHEGRPPQLYYIDNPPEFNDRLEMRAVPDSTSGSSQRIDNVQQQRTGNPGGGQSYDINYSARQFGPSRDISGQPYVNNISGITAYVIRQNPSVDRGVLSRLIELYINEARVEGINHDIAIAQMLYVTNFLSSQRITTHNYGGISSTPGWDGSFYDMTTGVRAHIQHIKCYASRAPLNRQSVDPRYNILVHLGYQGTVRTFDDLYRQWTANSANYGNSIDRILDELYRFSANY